MPSSFRHFSRSLPTMPRHLLLVLPEAPLELLPVALGEVLLGELLLGELLLGELLLGELLLGELLLGELLLGELLPVAPVELLPDAPAAPPDVLSELLPVAPALVPAAPDEEPVLCASDTLESANSAAAVAALMSFNVISVVPLLGGARRAAGASGAHARAAAARIFRGAAARIFRGAAARRAAAGSAAGGRARTGLLEVRIPFLTRDLPVAVLVHRREARGLRAGAARSARFRRARSAAGGAVRGLALGCARAGARGLAIRCACAGALRLRDASEREECRRCRCTYYFEQHGNSS
jgi:hypothetical protein